MKHRPVIVFCWLLLGLRCAEIHAQETAAKATPESTEIQSVINTLENQEARDRLIGQLKLLVQTQQEMTGSHETEKPTLGTTTVDLLKMLSDRLAKSVETTVKAATMFHEFHKVGRRQFCEQRSNDKGTDQDPADQTMGRGPGIQPSHEEAIRPTWYQDVVA